jgi:hypothetical protein
MEGLRYFTVGILGAVLIICGAIEAWRRLNEGEEELELP